MSPWGTVDFEEGKEGGGQRPRNREGRVAAGRKERRRREPTLRGPGSPQSSRRR